MVANAIRVDEKRIPVTRRLSMLYYISRVIYWDNGHRCRREDTLPSFLVSVALVATSSDINIQFAQVPLDRSIERYTIAIVRDYAIIYDDCQTAFFASSTGVEYSRRRTVRTALIWYYADSLIGDVTIDTSAVWTLNSMLSSCRTFGT